VIFIILSISYVVHILFCNASNLTHVSASVFYKLINLRFAEKPSRNRGKYNISTKYIYRNFEFNYTHMLYFIGVLGTMV
jgi:hypothetical protein